MTDNNWKPKRRVGRPSVAPRLRREPFSIRISRDELEQAEHVRPEHVPLGKFLRDIVLRATSQPKG